MKDTFYYEKHSSILQNICETIQIFFSFKFCNVVDYDDIFVCLSLEYDRIMASHEAGDSFHIRLIKFFHIF